MAKGGLLRRLGNIGGRIGGGIGKAVAGAPQAVGTGLGNLGTRAFDLAESARVPGLSENLFGESGKDLRFDLFRPQQQQAFSDILSQSMDQFQGSDFSFGPIADRARKQFQEQTVPSLAERFTGLGGQRSSAFGQQVGQAGADLESQLAAMESQFGLEEGKLLQSLMGLGLTPQFENILSPRQPGLLENLLTGIAPGFGKGFGARLAGGK